MENIIIMKENVFFSVTVAVCMFFCCLVLQGCQNKNNSEVKHVSKGASVHESASVKRDAGYIYGTVKETMNSGGYTYLLLEFEGKDFWVAVPQMTVSVGEDVMLMPGATMKNFHSNKLNRTFETIVFSQGPVSGGGPVRKAHASGGQMAKPHTGTPRLAKKVTKVMEPVTGPGAITVAQAYSRAKEFDGKTVVLRGKVVKVSKNILGKNWVHVQDGTGNEKNKDFDLTVTTLASPNIGDVVVVRGILHADKDFGAGYFYPVIIEEANVTAAK